MTVSGSFRRLTLGVGVLLAAATGGSALAQGVVKSSHGDWQIRCDTPPGAKTEQCALTQEVTAEDRPNFGMKVYVLKLKDEKQVLVRVQVPLGTLLLMGLGLKIDGVDVGNAPFRVCGLEGCTAEAVIGPDIIDRFKKGTTANFIVFQTPEFGISTPIALKGFGEGFDKLP